MVSRQDYGDTAESQIVMRSVVTSSSRNSKSSKSSSRASDRSKKAKAKLLRREVELKNLLKRQEMERQMECQIAAMKIQEDELKRRIALLTTEGEIEKAKAIDELYETLEYSKRGIEAELKLVYKDKTRDSLPPAKDLQVGPNFKSGDFKQVGRKYSKSVLNPGAQPWDLGPPQNTIGTGDPTGSQQLQEILTQQQEALQLMAYTIRQGFEMPKRELLTFDGNPLNYWLFINNFKVNIVKRVPDPETRLTYLIQHCTEKAREAIKNCAIMSGPEQGYRKAQEISYHRFGQKHIIAHAHITKIVEGPQIKNTDSTCLLDLSVEMQNCALTLVQMGYKADVNCSDHVVKVVKRLPVHLQSKWADRAGSLTLAGTEPSFMDLAGLVEEKALLANTRYGRIVGSTPDKEWSSKPPPKIKSLSLKGNTFVTQSEDLPRVNTAPIITCPLCSDQHRLWKCELMKAKSPEERKSFVRQARLCDNCLGSGHMAIDCRSKMMCQVNGCGWKHHTMLHVKKKSNNNSTPPNHPAVTLEETGASTISGTGETGTM